MEDMKIFKGWLQEGSKFCLILTRLNDRRKDDVNTSKWTYVVLGDYGWVKKEMNER